MSQERRFERGYDIYMDFWHRSAALQRFVGMQRARQTSMIDIDSVEYCWLCYQPLVIIETKRADATVRVGTVTANLARMAGLEAYLVAYQSDDQDIQWFEVQCWHPKSSANVRMSPAQYAEWLWTFRWSHLPKCNRGEAQHWMVRYEVRS